MWFNAGLIINFYGMFDIAEVHCNFFGRRVLNLFIFKTTGRNKIYDKINKYHYLTDELAFKQALRIIYSLNQSITLTLTKQRTELILIGKMLKKSEHQKYDFIY